MSLETTLGRDPSARSKSVASSIPTPTTKHKANASIYENHRSSHRGATGSLSSWSTPQNSAGEGLGVSETLESSLPYDANREAPWLVEFKAKGNCSHEKLAFHLLKLAVKQGVNFAEATNNESSDGEGSHRQSFNKTVSGVSSQFQSSGSFAIWKVNPADANSRMSSELNAPIALRRSNSWTRLMDKRSVAMRAGHPAFDIGDSPSVAAILLFPEETTSFHQNMRLLEYDYAMEIFQDSVLDAVTLCIGATHPLLKGGTTITMILDSIYAHGSTTARDDALLDPMERRRKRNILRHLPAIDLTCGVQNIYIPPQSNSYSDDGQTLFLPELEGGRMMLRFLGGIDKTTVEIPDAVLDGVMIVADFEAAEVNLQTEGGLQEFPELEIYDGTKLRTALTASMNGTIKTHLRPQNVTSTVSSSGPNVLNPLEAYEIAFSGTDLSVKIKEYSTLFGHRRIILPAESAFVVNVLESVVDMGFEGKTLCELSWDFQGLSPILQAAPLGRSPDTAPPEEKEQVSLLIAPLRQGRLSFQVSSVGGIQVKKAATSRDHKEGLFDWKFFNALVSPDDSSPKRIFDVIHDSRTMKKLLQVLKLVNNDLYKIADYALKQIWRAKDILDSEGVSEPGHVIPMYQMSRLTSLILTGDPEETSNILPLVRRVIEGDGLDVVAAKDLLRRHLSQYDEWAPEIDRVLRWAAMLTGPMVISPNVAGENIVPLAEEPHHAERFKNIPTASQLYDTVLEKPQLPLDPIFSNLVARVAPYLSFRQIEFLLESRSPSDWQQADLRRLRYVYSIKKKVLEIAESYGGLSFLPQSFLVSVFLGEATKSSLKVSEARAAKANRRGSTTDSISTRGSATGGLRLKKFNRRMRNIDGEILSPAQQASSFARGSSSFANEGMVLEYEKNKLFVNEPYELGDSLLGPQDVAILLQSGLTSVMKSSTVVQLNQRMLLDLISSQPHSFAVAVLAEIGSPSGEGSPRSLTSALMSLLELDQTAFTAKSKIDMHSLLESWLPGLKVPRRQDYMAGGRWARQSYYDAIFSVANSILEDAESYMALKGHLQRVRHHTESDPIPGPLGESGSGESSSDESKYAEDDRQTKILTDAIEGAKAKIRKADDCGYAIIDQLIEDEEAIKLTDAYRMTIDAYHDAFGACAALIDLDKHSFQLGFMKSYYKRNYDALMIKSLFDNVVEDVDDVRYWLQALRNGASGVPLNERVQQSHTQILGEDFDGGPGYDEMTEGGEWETLDAPMSGDGIFMSPEVVSEQFLVDAIIDAIIYQESDRQRLKEDPLVRLLIPNPPGFYDFAIVSAMGVITEGERGQELRDAFERLQFERGVIAVRAGTATARSFEYNASKIEEAIEYVARLGKPFGVLGYSQGCANVLMAETIMNSGTPKQQAMLQGLVCRQLLFSAANGSVHGPAVERKVQRLIVLCEGKSLF